MEAPGAVRSRGRVLTAHAARGNSDSKSRARQGAGVTRGPGESETERDVMVARQLSAGNARASRAAASVTPYRANLASRSGRSHCQSPSSSSHDHPRVVSGPDIRDVLPEHLERTEDLLELHAQAAAARLIDRRRPASSNFSGRTPTDTAETSSYGTSPHKDVERWPERRSVQLIRA